MRWRAPFERTRTASRFPIEVDLTDDDAVPAAIRAGARVIATSRYEWMFWDAAWRRETWPV
jgi:hypothetical protein